MVLLWFALQVQHTLAPLMPWVEAVLWPEPLPFALLDEMAMLLVVAALYLAWSLGFCWRVRGVPPYPVMRAAWRDGVRVWLPLYAFVIASGIGIVCLRHTCAPPALPAV